jgi:hypothetical protein
MMTTNIAIAKPLGSKSTFNLMFATFFFNKKIKIKGKKFNAHSHSNVKP